MKWAFVETLHLVGIWLKNDVHWFIISLIYTILKGTYCSSWCFCYKNQLGVVMCKEFIKVLT